MTGKKDLSIIRDIIMEQTPFNRAYLETLSMKDLVELADENGIDIPEGLNRRFIIGELLELVDDSRPSGDSGVLVEGEYTSSPAALPETYNETQITVLLRDPGWIFVYWDFHATLYSALCENHHFESFFLRVNSLSDTKPSKVTDYFDIDVGVHDRKWYVHLSNMDSGCRVDLYSRNIQEKEQLLARSAELLLVPAETAGATQSRRNPPLVDLSGVDALRKALFRNHR